VTLKAPALFALVCIVFLGGGVGAYMALRLQQPSAGGTDDEAGQEPEEAREPAREPDRAPEVKKAPARARPEPVKAILPTPPGYYLTALRTTGLDIDAMTPTLLSPLSRENVPADCPERMAVVTGDDSHAKTIKPFFDAVGAPGLSGTEATGLKGQAARQLERVWRVLNSLANGPVSTPPLRILYKHYPRPDLPGKCIALHATVYTVIDTYFDQERFKHDPAKPDQELRGVIFELRKTYQLEGEKPRLVEALIESHESIHMGRRFILRELIGDKAPKPLADHESSAHFIAYSGGLRFGLVWVDRSAGIGQPAPWARAYSIKGGSMAKRPDARMEQLPAVFVRRLIELVGRF